MPALAAVRRRHFLSQRELAKKANVALGTIARIELGQTQPRYRVVRAISEALGVEPLEVDEFRRLVEGEADAQTAAAA